MGDRFEAPRKGHSTERIENGTILTLRCSCGWTVDGLVGAPDNAEILAYEHITGETADPGNEARVKAAGLWTPEDEYYRQRQLQGLFLN